MNILILGGTSFFGKEIASVFFSAGHNVTTFSRVKQSAHETIKHIEGNRGSKEDLLRAQKLAAWDIVIDNLAFEASDVELSLAIFSGVSRYILTSSVSVYNFIPDEEYLPPIKESAVRFDYSPSEEDEKEFSWKYSRGKLETERFLMKHSKSPWTIIRPPVVYGPYDPTARGFWYLQKLLAHEEIALPNDGANRFQLCGSTDLARAFLLAAETPLTSGKVYNVAMKEILTLKSFIELSAQALQVTPNFIAEEKPGDLGGPYAKMENRIYDCSAAYRDFGFQHSPLPNIIRETALWYQKVKL